MRLAFLSLLIAIVSFILYFNTAPVTTLAVGTYITALLPKLSRFYSTSLSSNTTIMAPSATVSLSNTPPTFKGLPVIPHQDPSLTTTSPTARKIATTFVANEVSEGAGAKVRRSIGTPRLRHLSPFLMLDHFSVARGAGFPDHPHRGQETITYLMQGAVDHEDFAGNKGTLYPGDLQFMTAGRGIVHAEMPRHDSERGGEVDSVVGMQLWVDLPENLKMCEPRYRDLKGEEIPIAEVDGVTVKVISGRSHGVDSLQELAYTPVWLLDVTIRPGGKIEQRLPKGWNAFAYTYKGDVTFGAGSDKRSVGKWHNVVFEQQGDSVSAEVDADASQEAQFILVAGLPLDQKIIQYGPFVLTSQQAVHEAVRDYQTSSNGFERAEGWESEIGKAMAY